MDRRIAAASGVLVAVIASLALFAGSASAVVYTGDDGGAAVGCSHNGTTIIFDQWVASPPCLSYQTGFYAKMPGVSGPDTSLACALVGYEAQVFHVTSTSDYIPRYDQFWCPNGVWHYSSAWDHNEFRYSDMTIYAANVYFSIVQFKL